MRIVVLGLSITSSWGNGHATTYRALLRGLHERGHSIVFLERDKPWYQEHRDMPEVSYAGIELYDSVEQLASKHRVTVQDADLVIVGSYVPDGVTVGDWVSATARGVKAFYDIDTPVTMAKLARGDEEYLAKRQIGGYGLYLSFTGGPTLRSIERLYGSPMARALYCSVDPHLYFPDTRPLQWLLGYLGTYSADRQPGLTNLLIQPAEALPNKRFAVAGPLYPAEIEWPANVDRMEHLPPPDHREFYNSQAFALNITRADMRRAGYSPSVRLFEAAACGTPVITDCWPGLEELFVPGEEILVACSTAEMLKLLTATSPEKRRQIAERARTRVLREHTAAHRAVQIEQYVREYSALRGASATSTKGDHT